MSITNRPDDGYFRFGCINIQNKEQQPNRGKWEQTDLSIMLYFTQHRKLRKQDKGIL